MLAADAQAVMARTYQKFAELWMTLAATLMTANTPTQANAPTATPHSNVSRSVRSTARPVTTSMATTSPTYMSRPMTPVSMYALR